MKLAQAYADWLYAQNFNLFGTLKFVDGEGLNVDIANKRFRYFFNKLDRKVRTHKEIKAGNRLKRFVFIELGKSRENTHAHFFTKGIITWANRLWQTVDMASDIELKLIEDKEGIKGYCTKELDTIDTDILLTDCTH